MSHLTSWQDEYLSALQVRDRKERASKAIYDACAYGPHSDTSFQGYYSLNSDTRLADRAAALDALASENPLNERSDATSAQTRQTSGFIVNPSSPSGDALTRARQDLSDAHHVKGMMQSRLDSLSEELQKLKLKTQLDSKRIKDLHVEKTALTTRMKDQDEELKGKAKLLEDVHDENLSLTLQLNMAEEHSQTLVGENKDLVDRWMARMGEEAEAMNKASRFS